MALNPSLQALIDAASGIFFVLVGAATLFLAPRSRRATLVAAFCILFGGALAYLNLFFYDSPAIFIGGALLELGATIAAVMLGLDIARGALRGRTLTLALAPALLMLVSVVVSFAMPDRTSRAQGVVTREDPSAFLVLVSVAGFLTMLSGLAFLAGACIARWGSTPADARTERRGLALAAAAFGGYLAFFAGHTTTTLFPEASTLFSASAVVLAASPLVVGHVRDPRLGRRTTLAIVGAGFLGMALLLLIDMLRLDAAANYGEDGIARTIACALFALALIRDGLLGADVHELAKRRGSLAVAGLAAFLIVAQVAQNFVASEYGLLLGGVIAGVLVIAARPLERALDGRTPAARAKSTAERERSFRAAARRFYRVDGGLTHEEERELMLIGEQLGLSVARIYEVRDEVEKESRTR